MNKTLLIVMLLLLVCVKVDADESFFDRNEVSISYSVFTEHLSNGTQDNGEDYNEDNHIIGLSVNRWFASTFVNSYDDRSYSFGRNFRTRKWKPYGDRLYGRANLLVGAVYGYDEHLPDIAGFTPGALPMFEVGYGRFAIDTLVIPSDSTVMSILLKITF
jgi:hypothetical protein